ncbi:MAG UNVERIFIED_CONTAM: hypothetical protein LVR29_05960 [Microcystis novacekii LVE1205-3]
MANRYLLFVTDVYRGQGETNETDNIIATPITLTAPDLTVTACHRSHHSSYQWNPQCLLDSNQWG